MASIFKTVAWQIDQLVGGIANGTIQLPDLQRPFVWPTTKVRDLFDSMYRGYPVGELMFWDDPDFGKSRSISGNSQLGASHQIIDGQQRLTSLFAAIKGLPVRDSSYRKKSVAISFNPFSERFEVRTPALEKSPQWVASIAEVFESPNRAKKAFFKRWEAAHGELPEDEEEQLEDIFTKLFDLKNYTFNVVHIDKDVEKSLVADVFVRINSEGMRLKSSDYILTWLSVFWPEGREEIEEFARLSRLTPEGASEQSGTSVTWTPINPFLSVETSHIVRAMVAVGQNRARLQDAYTALLARDPSTGAVDDERMDTQLAQLKAALPVVTDRVNWTEFIHSLQLAGFRSGRNITSTMNIIYSYVLFLLGRTRFNVDLALLRSVIARWVFMSQMTGRYTGSGESQLSKDLDRIAAVGGGDAGGFIRVLDEMIDAELTPDFWQFGVPSQLISSGASLSPVYQCYLAALNILEARMFMLDMPVSHWMDPSLPSVKGLEGHHLFPRAYLQNVLGITDIKRINQVANFAPTDWNTNIQISDKPPATYWPALVASCGFNAEQLARQRYWHALPDGWEHLSYDEFLAERRLRIAQVTRDGFECLRRGQGSGPIKDYLGPAHVPEPSLGQLVDAGILRPGDLLDPVDPDWVVDAMINDESQIVIDGIHVFDDLDDAARFLEVSQVSGMEFWALEKGDELTPLTELTAQLEHS